MPGSHYKEAEELNAYSRRLLSGDGSGSLTIGRDDMAIKMIVLPKAAYDAILSAFDLALLGETAERPWRCGADGLMMGAGGSYFELGGVRFEPESA